MNLILATCIVYLTGCLTGCLSPNRLLVDRAPALEYNQLVNTQHHGWTLIPASCPHIRTPKGDVNPEANFSCATQRNFALMLADPMDLVPHKRPPMRYAAKPLGQAVKAYEQGTAKQLSTQGSTEASAQQAGVIGYANP